MGQAPPMSSELLANLIRFARTLRALGFAVRPEGVHDAVRALEVVGVTSRTDVRETLRTVLVSRRDDFNVFDGAFEQFWRPRADSPATPAGPAPPS